MKKIATEQIVWKSQAPPVFLCMICRKENASFRDQYEDPESGLRLNLCLCRWCHEAYDEVEITDIY